MSLPLVSVLIPAYNRPDDLRRLLEDLNRQTARDFEVVVVDDASTTPLTEAVNAADCQYPVRIVRNETNQGIGYSRNRCIEESRGRLLLWVDSDARVPNAGWIRWHVSQHARGGPERVVHGTVLGATPNYSGRTFMYSNWFCSCGAVSRPVTDHHVPTINTSLSRTLFERVGFFDPALRAAEDVDWSLRALAAGVPLWYEPGMPVLHSDRNTLKGVWASYRNMGKYGQRLRLKHPSSPHGWLFPKQAWTAPLYVLPLSMLMTVYVIWSWVRVDWRVLLYTPGLFVANLAYAIGAVDAFTEAP